MQSDKYHDLTLGGTMKSKIDDDIRISLLYDFYSGLLSRRQREVMRLYHEENLSLAEIAAEYDISRQAVHDALKNAQISLRGYEEKLGLVDKFTESDRAIRDIDSRIERLMQKKDCDEEIKTGLKEIRDIIDGLND